MNSILASPPVFPHQLHNAHLSPTRSGTSTYQRDRRVYLKFMLTLGVVSHPHSIPTTRKRKADDDEPSPDDRMSASPSNSPGVSSRSLPIPRQMKRAKSGPAGRPLALARLLETLDVDSLRGVLRSICDRHPDIGSEVVNTAPRPSASSALSVLNNYESALQASFPFGGNSTSDYAYNRVKQALLALLDALNDFTPHFLPPNESQATQSLGFLDGATDIIHRLPNWDTFQNNLHKQNAYDEISKAWALVIREAAKRAGGIQLQYGGWDQKLAKHNQLAHGKLQEAVDEMRMNLGWMGGQPQTQQLGGRGNDVNSVRQELLSGTYGANLPVRVGPW